MPSINELPMEIKMNVLSFVTNDDFARCALVNRDWNHACRLKKHPLQELYLHTLHEQENQLQLTISGRFYGSSETTVVFEQVDAATAKAHYTLKNGASFYYTSPVTSPDAYIELALNYFFQLLREYRVDSVDLDMFDSPLLNSLLKEKLQKFRYRCGTLYVREAPYEMIDILSRSFRADNYSLGLASNIPPKPLPVHSNILHCPGIVHTSGLFLFDDVSLLQCHTLDVLNADCSIDISILEKWAVEYRDGVAGRKKFIRMQSVKANHDDIREIVKRNSNSYTRYGPGTGDLACGFRDSSGKMAILEFAQKDHGHYSVGLRESYITKGDRY